MMGNNGALKEKLANVASDLLVDELGDEFSSRLANELRTAMNNIELSSVSQDDLRLLKRAIGHALADAVQVNVDEALDRVFGSI